MLGEVLEWVYLGYNVPKNFVEYEVNACTALTFSGYVLYKVAVQLVAVRLYILAYEI